MRTAYIQQESAAFSCQFFGKQESVLWLLIKHPSVVYHCPWLATARELSAAEYLGCLDKRSPLCHQGPCTELQQAGSPEWWEQHQSDNGLFLHPWFSSSSVKTKRVVCFELSLWTVQSVLCVQPRIAIISSHEEEDQNASGHSLTAKLSSIDCNKAD